MEKIIGKLDAATISANITGKENIQAGMTIPGSVSQRDYEKLENKPQINDVELVGNKNSEELGLQQNMVEITPQDIDEMLFGKEGLMKVWLKKTI